MAKCKELKLQPSAQSARKLGQATHDFTACEVSEWKIDGVDEPIGYLAFKTVTGHKVALAGNALYGCMVAQANKTVGQLAEASNLTIQPDDDISGKLVVKKKGEGFTYSLVDVTPSQLLAITV